MAERLTETFVKGLKPPARGERFVWDDELTGFAIKIFAPTRAHPTGARTFVLSYRLNGTERRYRVGSWPDWSVTAARAEAREIRQRVDRGEDPAGDRRERRQAPTLLELAERYKREHLPRKSEQSRHDDGVMLGHILRHIGADAKVADVHHGDIVALHRAITQSGHPVLANRTVACASRMFALALKPLAGENKPWRDQAQGNPCKGIERNPETAKERFLSPAEIAALSDALAAYGGAARGPGIASARAAVNCMRLIMLTGCRPGEALQARWEQFDAEPGFWVKPSAHTKQRRVHKAPLAPAPLQLIDQMRKERSSPWVFPGQVPGEPLKQLWSVWYACRETATVALWAASGDEEVARLVARLRAGLKREPSVLECQKEAGQCGVRLPTGLLDARVYDLRHTFASVGAGGGLSLQIIGRLLGHTQARTTQRYAHLADDPLREAADRIASAITRAGEGGKVVKLRDGR